MPVARLFRSGSFLICETPYDPEFVADLKRSIPAMYREWVPDDKVWFIARTHEREIVAVCQRHFDDVEFVSKNEPTKPSTVIPEHYQRLYVLPGAPKPVVEAAYRALSRMHHPDISSDPDATSTMQRINAAYERVLYEVGS